MREKLTSWLDKKPIMFSGDTAVTLAFSSGSQDNLAFIEDHVARIERKHRRTRSKTYRSESYL